MYKSNFIKILFFSFLIGSLGSCDNDSNELGSDIVGENNFETGTPEFYAVNAETKSTNAVETLNLPVNALGIYKNPVFGTTKASLAVQLQMDNANLNPTLTDRKPIIQSVVLKIPYFSTKGTTDASGVTSYTLDSIYGPSNSRIKLRIYESKYYIRDIDPTTQTTQKYYSNQEPEFSAEKGAWLNNATDLSQNDEFFFSSSEIVEPGTPTTEDPTPDDVRSAPALKVALDTTFFANKILKAPTDKLLNNNVFKEYLRGLYFEVNQSGSDEGNLAMLNLAAGKITIKYSQYKSAPTTEVPVPEREDKTFVMNLNGKSVGFFNTTSTLSPSTDKIYLKGGEGTMAVIDLFGPDADNDGVADKLEELRSNNWLVNDASLTFHIDSDAMGSTAKEPNRIYLYDLNNKRPLVDYYADSNTSSSKPKYSKSTFSGIIQKSGGRGSYYKIRITNHIRALLKNTDSTNVRLGLVVTENIGDVTNRKLRTPAAADIKELPVSSITNPLGTILFGSGPNVDFEKRMQLKIYFTKPKQN